jgi:Rap1a immunity proteins
MKFLVLFFFFVSIVSAHGAELKSDGNELLSKCGMAVRFADGQTTMNSPSSYDVGFCYGLMRGIFALNELRADKKDRYFCPPDGVTNSQAARIVYKRLNDSPEILHFDESVVAIVALQMPFPCK